MPRRCTIAAKVWVSFDGASSSHRTERTRPSCHECSPVAALPVYACHGAPSRCGDAATPARPARPTIRTTGIEQYMYPRASPARARSCACQRESSVLYARQRSGNSQ